MVVPAIASGVGRWNVAAVQDETTMMLTVGAQMRTYSRPVKSCMPNAYFGELKMFQISDGLVFMQLDVFGFVSFTHNPF